MCHKNIINLFFLFDLYVHKNLCKTIKDAMTLNDFFLSKKILIILFINLCFFYLNIIIR